jgi:hypothetical protein
MVLIFVVDIIIVIVIVIVGIRTRSRTTTTTLKKGVWVHRLLQGWWLSNRGVFVLKLLSITWRAGMNKGLRQYQRRG